MAKRHYEIIKHYDGKPFSKVNGQTICFKTKHNQVLCHQCVCDNMRLCEDPSDEYNVIGHMTTLQSGFQPCLNCGSWPWLKPKVETTE